MTSETEAARDGGAEARFVERNLRWNFSLGTVDGAFFGTFLVFADVNLVMPWLLSQLTTSKWIIGLPPILMTVGGQLPQLVAAHFIQGSPYRRPFVLRGSVIRGALFLLMMPFLFFSLGGPEVTLLGVILPYAASCFAVSFIGLSWQELTAKIIPARRLSSYFGIRSFVGGLLGLGASAFVGWYLGAVQTVPLPKFGLVLLLAIASISIAAASNAPLREPPGPVRTGRPSLRQEVAEAARVSWSDRTFRYYLLTRALLTVSALVAPLYILDGKTNYGLLAQSIGTFTMAGLVAGIVASLGWSLLGDRLGLSALTRIVALLSAAPPLLALAMPLLTASPLGPVGGWLLVFLALGAATTGQQNVSFRGVIQLARPDRRSLMIGFGNTFSGLVSLAGPLIGLLADAAGAPAAFAVAASGTLVVVAIAGLLRPPTTAPTAARATG